MVSRTQLIVTVTSCAQPDAGLHRLVSIEGSSNQALMQKAGSNDDRDARTTSRYLHLLVVEGNFRVSK